MTDPRALNELIALRSGAAALELHIDDSQGAAMIAHLDAVYRWNEYAGLTSVSRSDAIRLHVLDSLSITAEIDGCQSIVDLGSGGGFPGIPLAITRPDSRFTLVEARARRSNFLREVVRDLHLTRSVRVVQGDAHGISTEEPFDAVVSRAFLPPSKLLVLGARLLSIDGRLIVMGGGEADDDGAANSGDVSTRLLGLALKHERQFSLPGGSERRRVSVYEKRLPA